MEYLQKQGNLRRKKRWGEGNGSYFTLSNMYALMPAVKSRCLRQNLKVVAQKNTNTPPRRRTIALHLRKPGAK
jgi:hypothetical protein